MFSKKLVRRIAAAMLVAHLTASSWAADALSLTEALRIAASQSRLLMAQDAGVVAAQEMSVSASQLPDPVLKLGIDNLPVNGPDRFSLTRDFMTQRRIGVAQELPRADKRQARAVRFERDALKVHAERQAALANLQRDTAMAWSDRYYSERMHELLLRQLEEFRLQVEAADIAFRTGRGSQVDALAARAAVLGLEDRVSQIERQTRSAAVALSKWTGKAADRPLQGVPMWRNSRNALALTSEHLGSYPQMAVLEAQTAAAEAELRVAQASRRPDWSVEASYSQRGPAYSNMLSIGVSIPLQWDQTNRQDREVAAKAAMVTEARARYDDMLRTHEAEIRALQNDWQSGKERLDRYEAQLLPMAAQRVEAALTAYRTGKADLTSVLMARRDAIETRMQALTLEMETARLWAQLNYLTPETAVNAQRKEQP